MRAAPLLPQQDADSPSIGRAAVSDTLARGKGEVLVLYGLSSEAPAFAEWSRGIREGLRDKQRHTPTLHVEILDLARREDEQYTQEWLKLLRYKYANRDIRVVMPVLDPALQFAKTHLRDVFPDAAIVFASVDERIVKEVHDTDETTGVVYRADIGKTCELALQLRPRTRRVICIGGNSSLDKSLLDHARRELELDVFRDRIEIEYWEGLPLGEVVRRVKTLPDDHVIVYVTYFTDIQGQNYIPAEVATDLCDASPVPVFACYKTLLDHGVVGGHMIDLEAQALEAGRMARRILDGQDANSLKIHGQELNRSLVHWQRLRHWNIPESNVPSHVTILHRIPTFWESYRWLIVATFTLVMLQSGLIATLAVNRIRRRTAEQALKASQDVAQRQRDELARFNRVNTVGELAASIAHEVNQPLSAIVSNAQAATRLLGQLPPDVEEVNAALRDIANDGNRAASILNRVRSLARKEQPTLSSLDLNEVVRDVLRLVAPDADTRQIGIHDELDDALPPITGDRIALQQVIMNLLINAAQAMQETKPESRRIVIRTTHEAGTVHLSVEDSGIGLNEEQLRQIFETFYTTRPGGIGMGLSISQSIVESHGGAIWATQNADGGATFHVSLPVASAERHDSNDR